MNIDYTYYPVAVFGAWLLFLVLMKQASASPFSVLSYYRPEWLEHPLGKIFESGSFALIGGFAGLIIGQPENAQQAFTSGLGCTGLLMGAISSPLRGEIK